MVLNVQISAIVTLVIPHIHSAWALGLHQSRLSAFISDQRPICLFSLHQFCPILLTLTLFLTLSTQPHFAPAGTLLPSLQGLGELQPGPLLPFRDGWKSDSCSSQSCPRLAVVDRRRKKERSYSKNGQVGREWNCSEIQTDSFSSLFPSYWKGAKLKRPVA